MAEQEAQTTESAENQQSGSSLSLLASQYFGNQYKGEVTQPESSSGEETETTETEEETETTEQEGTEAETSEEDAEKDSESEGEDTEGEDEEEKTISSLDELVEHYEWDPEWAENLEVPVKVDGESKRVNLADLKKSFQMNEAAEKRLEEAKSKAKSQSEEIVQQRQQVDQEIQKAATLVQEAENLVSQDEQSINWQDLRENDPAEYSAKKAEFAERRNQIEQMKQKAVEQYQQYSQQSQQMTEEQKKEILQQENQKLLERIPEWQDSETAEKEKKEVAQFLVNQGMTQEEVNNATDHRLIDLARKAMLYEQSRAKTDTAKKKVKKVPKTLKSGKPKSQQQVNQEKLSKQKQQLRKSGKLEDAFQYLRAQRGG